jgi:choline dehydrogenase-like flavoprotein
MSAAHNVAPPAHHHHHQGNPAGNPELGPLRELEPGTRRSADVVVVGSGAGGAVVAATLAGAGLEVIVVEEGPMVTTDDVRRWSVAERMVRLYRDSGTSAALGRPPLALPMGRCVGGTTTVNSGTCFRAPDAVLDGWARRGLGALSAGNLAPLFDELESVLGVREIGRDIMGGNARAAERGAAALGMPGGLIHRNERGCIGSGQCPMGCPQGAKQDMRMTFLPRAQYAGAAIHAGVRARRLLVDDGAVRGVEADRVDVAGRALSRSRSDRIILRAPLTVLAAGPVFTPLLLLRAGIGGRHVGRHLAVHPCSDVAGFVDERVDGWRGVQQSYWIHPEPGVTIEATFPPGGTGLRYLPLNGMPLKAAMARLAHAVLLGLMVVDGGNGRVRLLPTGQPLVTYRLGGAEAGRLVRGLAHAARVLRAAGAREVYTPLRRLPVLEAGEDPAVLERASAADLTLVAFHPSGTARMSALAADGVAGADGRVFGVGGVAVADASLLPSAPGVNPQMTIMALALHVARSLAPGRESPL